MVSSKTYNKCVIVNTNIRAKNISLQKHKPTHTAQRTCTKFSSLLCNYCWYFWNPL